MFKNMILIKHSGKSFRNLKRTIIIMAFVIKNQKKFLLKFKSNHTKEIILIRGQREFKIYYKTTII